MKWLLFLVFINTNGGIITERIDMASEDQCGAALKAVLSSRMNDQGGNMGRIAFATCFEAKR